MNILTKICIVLVTVVALMVVPVFVAQATVPENWRQHYLNEREAKQAAEATSRQYQIAAMNASTEIASLRSAMAQDKEQLQARLAEANRKLKSKDLEMANLSASYQQLASSYERAQQALDKEIAFRNSVVDQRDQCRERLDDVIGKNRQLNERLVTVEGQRERLLKQDRLRLEKIAELEQEIGDLQVRVDDLLAGRAVADGTGAGAPAPGEGPEITGTITAVSDGLASINVGSAQGVEKGMKLMVYRGASFVAYLRVEEVQVDRAAGVLTDQQVEPTRGDKVATVSTLE